jgi:hypothetical protein
MTTRTQAATPRRSRRRGASSAFARRLAAFARRLAALAYVSLAVCAAASGALAQVCGNSGQDGVGALSGVVNTYFPGAASASVGAVSITLGTMRAGGSTTPIAAGDLLLVIQMQDGTFNSTNGATYGDGATGRGATNTNNAGLYEYVVALSASAGNGAVSIRGANGGGLVNAYTNAAANSVAGGGAQGVRRFQVIRVPQYSSATLSGTLAAPAWMEPPAASSPSTWPATSASAAARSTSRAGRRRPRRAASGGSPRAAARRRTSPCTRARSRRTRRTARGSARACPIRAGPGCGGPGSCRSCG